MENTLYWITRCDDLRSMLLILFFSLIIFLVISFIRYSSLKEDKEFINDCDDLTELKNAKKLFFIEKKISNCLLYIKKSIIAAIVILLLLAFIPSTKDCYIIYGVGNTIEYLQNNKEAQKLPNNAIKALNYYLDKEITDDSIKASKNKSDSTKIQ